MAPFDRSYDFLSVCHCKYSSILYHIQDWRSWHHSIDHTTSYQSAIVNITLSSTIFEIFEIGEDHEMEINVKVTQPANLSMSGTLLKFTDLALPLYCWLYESPIFVHFYTDGSENKLHNEIKVVHYRRSKPFEVIKICTNLGYESWYQRTSF